MELLSILAAVLEISGLFLLSIKNRLGFLFNIVAGISWIIYSLVTKNAIGLILVCSIALILNTKGFFYWKRN